MNDLLTRIIKGLCAAVAIAAFTSTGAGAQQKPAFVNGEFLISVTHGTTLADVQTIAGKANANVVRPLGTLDGNLTDTYYLRSKNGLDSPKTLDAVNVLKNADPRVQYAGPNKLDYPTQTGGATAVPNDPRFNEQWDKTFLRLPEAWTLEKGKSNVVIVIMDTGVDIDHPEFKGLGSRLLAGYNSFTKTNDPRPTGANPDGHGTHVAGIATATTNNAIGVAGGAWENVKLLPINAFDPGVGGFPQSSIIEAISFIVNHQKNNPGLSYVVNMSLGGARPSDTPDLTDPENAAILDAAKKGIVFSIAAGNNGDVGNPPVGPANMAQAHQNILCIGSSNHLGQRAYYSEFRPYTTVAAPGGDDQAGKLILSTLPVAQGSFGLEQGTSMAAPNATGVISLLLSVPGVSPSDIKNILTTTARPQPGKTLPTPELGYGIVDAYAALLKVAIGVTIITPQGTGGKSTGSGIVPEPVETLRPEVRIQVSQITPDNLTITIDGGTPIPYVAAGITPPANSPYFTIDNVTATTPDPNNAGQTLPAVYQAVLHNVDFSPGNHSINVTGTKTNSSGTITVSDVRNFTVQPHVFLAGRSMISFPYYEYIDLSGNVVADPHDPSAPNNITPQIYLGTNFRLARWLPDQERYVFYSSFGQTENSASFTPGDVLPRQDGDPATPAFAKWPVGLGFWADVESNKPVLTKGQPLTDKAFIIPLKTDPNAGANAVSWNMIGDPFPFDVPFNSLLVDTPLGRISIQEAATRGYILPNIYTYDGANGYTFQSLPAGALRAWTGHWVGLTSNVDLNLVVPPAKISRAAIAATRSAGTSGWLLQLGAHSKNLHDAFNFIGATSRAVDGYDSQDAPKPPMAGPFVSLAINHDDWTKNRGLYAQDMRAASGNKTWSVVVNTDQPNSDVTVTWNSATLPRNVRLTVRDESNGQVYDMRSRASLTFNSGATPGPRNFTISSTQSAGRTLRIANLNVRSGNRATGTNVIGFSLTGDATYEVRVLSATGGTVATVGSRAAAAGGDVSVLWNGRDSSGKSVAAGTYIIQVRATTAEGESVKAIQPFTVVR